MPRNISTCKKCKAQIAWMVTAANKPIPVDLASISTEEKYNLTRGLSVRFNKNNGHIAHFATCPFATNFRRPRKRDEVITPPVPYKDN